MVKITLLDDPAAKLIRIKVHVFLDSTLCVGSHFQIHPIIGQQNWRMYGRNMDLSKN